MAWHRFTRTWSPTLAVRSVCGRWCISAPTRSPRRTPARRGSSVSTPSQDVLMRVPFLRSSIDVPAGVAASLEHELHDRGIPALGIWAQVPHYIASMSYPAASVALLDGMREATGLVVDAATLRGEVMIQRRRLDALVVSNDEHRPMIEQLEQIYDAGDDESSRRVEPPTVARDALGRRDRRRGRGVPPRPGLTRRPGWKGRVTGGRWRCRGDRGDVEARAGRWRHRRAPRRS